MTNGKYVTSSVLLAIGTGIYMANGVRFLLPSHPRSIITATVLISVVFSAYSLTPKPKHINGLNWLLVPIMGLVFVYVSSIFVPDVMNGFMWALVFSIFTFFIPAGIYLVLVIANFIACTSLYDSKEESNNAN